MKILLTNHHFQYYGGSETAILALHNFLVKKDHDVHVWSSQPSNGGIRTKVVHFRDSINWDKDHYDLALVNHNSCMKMIASQSKRIADKIIFTSHGPLGGLEAPISGADAYVAVSEEIARAYPDFDFKIIRNAVDMNRFNQRTEPSLELKKVLLLSNRTSKEGVEFLKECVKEVGSEFKQVGINVNFTPDVEEEIAQADMVFTVGRGVLEAVSMGKQVYIWDHRLYNGRPLSDSLFTVENALVSMKFNYSGRARKLTPNKSDLLQILKRYKPNSLRWFIERYHNIETEAQKYIDLYNSMLVKTNENKKKVLVIGGLRNFNRSHSLSGIIKTEAKMFREQGHETGLMVHKDLAFSNELDELDVNFYKELSNPTDTYERIKPIVSQYDIITTHDFAWLEAMEWLDQIMDKLENDFPEKLFLHHIHSSPGMDSCPSWKKGRVKPNMFYTHPGEEISRRVADHLQVPREKVLQFEYTNDVIDQSGGDENLWHELDIIDYDFVGFYPAHPYEGKNIDAILPIIKALKDRGKTVKYIFTANNVRDGRTRVDGYKDMARDMGIEDSILWMYDIPRFRGHVDYPTVKKIWARANLFIHPSLSEANPLILMEAMFNKMIMVLNKDFGRFHEMSGDGVIYHPFGNHLGAGRRIQDEKAALSVADAIITHAQRSPGYLTHNRLVRNYNRKKLYTDYMEKINQPSPSKLKPKVSVVIPILNLTPLEGKEPELIQFTKDCIASVREENDDVEIIVINNNPDDKHDYGADVQLNQSKNIGVSASWNLGLVEARGDYVMFLNSDVVLTLGWKNEMLKYADDGLVFPWYQKEVLGGGIIPPEKFEFPHVQGSCFMAHKHIFRKIGPFDQTRYPLAYAEDQDYWERAKINGVPAYRAKTSITHKGNGTSSKLTKPELIKNNEIVERFGNENTFRKLFKHNNQAFVEWWDKPVKGV